MPRFFFDIRRHGTITPDAEGSELPDLAAARQEALISLRQLVADVLRGPDAADVEQIEITDADGKVLAVVWWTDAMQSLR